MFDKIYQDVAGPKDGDVSIPSHPLGEQPSLVKWVIMKEYKVCSTVSRVVEMVLNVKPTDGWFDLSHMDVSKR